MTIIVIFLVFSGIVVAALALVCSVAVSLAAVGLRPLQEANARDDLKRNLLISAGLLEERDASADVDALFERIEARVVDLDSGESLDIPRLPSGRYLAQNQSALSGS